MSELELSASIWVLLGIATLGIEANENCILG